jgi:hypothetical protein
MITLYHRKTPRHNWIAYSHMPDNEPRYTMFCSAIVRDTLYWDNDASQIARVDYAGYTGNAYDLPDNVKTLPDNAIIRPINEAIRLLGACCPIF